MSRIRLSRRSALKLLGAGAVGSQGIAGVSASMGDATDSHRVRESATVTFEAGEGRMVYTFEYHIPDPVTELQISFNTLGWYGFRTVAETTNLERQGEEYVWTGDGQPRVVIEDDLDSNSFTENDLVYYDTDEAFIRSVPDGNLDWDSTAGESVYWGGEEFTFDGEGYATDGMAFAGPHERVSRTVGETEVSVVVPDSVEQSIPAGDGADLFEQAMEFIGNERTYDDEKGVFVLPETETTYIWSLYSGSFMIRADNWNIETLDNLPLFLFAYANLGGFGEGRTQWLTDAMSEYYSYRVALGAGLGDFDEFYNAVRANGRNTDAMLTDAGTIEETDAAVTKGPHVLAALDAEIQRRTDGQRLLLDVFRLDADLETYDGFESAIIDLVDDDAIRVWLDRYIDGTELPEIPREPGFFEFGPRFFVSDYSPQSPIVEKGGELSVRVELFNTGPVAGETTAELLIDGEQYGTKDVSLESGESMQVIFDSVDTSGLDAGEYTYTVRVDDIQRETAPLSILDPASFEITSVDPETIEVESGQSFDISVSVENVGGARGDAAVELFVGETTGVGGPVADDRVSLLSGESGTTEFENIDTANLDPGEHPVVVQTGDDEFEVTLRVVEPTPTPSPTPEPTPEPTETPAPTDTATETPTDGSGPGFGVGTVLTSIGGAGYLLKQRLQGDENE